MTLRLLTGAAVLAAAPFFAFAQQAPQPRVQETQPRKRAASDPAINPSAGAQPPAIPAQALAGDTHTEEETREGWAAAKWTVHTLQPYAGARQTVSVPTPSVVLLRASWPGSDNVTITVTKSGKTLASFTGARGSSGGRLATARISVPSAGDIVIVANGARSTKVTLHVGVLATP